MRTIDGRTWRLRLTGRPRHHSSVWTWLAAGVFRNWRGISVGILCAWFPVPLVLMAGAIGAVLGGVAGMVSGTPFDADVVKKLDILIELLIPIPVDSVTDLVPTAAWQIGGIIGAIWGAAFGAVELGWMAAIEPWRILFGGDPAWPVQLAAGQIITAIFVGCLYTVWSMATEEYRLSGARVMSQRERDWIMPLVEDVAIRMNLPGIPRVLVTDSREANAYAETRHIVIHRGLIDHLAYDTDAVAGVICHELEHWRRGDPVAAAFARGVALPLYLLYELAQKILSAAERVRPVQWMLRLLLWGVTATVEWILAPAQAAEQRRREWRADAAAAAAGKAAGLRTALLTLAASFDTGRSGWDEVMMASHPPSELRAERLQDPDRTYVFGPGADASPATANVPGTPAATSDTGW